MLNKPNDFDNALSFGAFETLSTGSHILKICDVRVGMSKKKKPMLTILLDTAPEDKQPMFFTNKYHNDTRTDKKWGCIYYQLIYNDAGGTNGGFKNFITSVEESNPNFKVQWGEMFESSLKNKKIGGVFGLEEYTGNDGQPRQSVKLQLFRSVDAIIKGVDIPKPKTLEKNSPPVIPGIGNGFDPLAGLTPPPPKDANFVPIPNDEDIPF